MKRCCLGAAWGILATLCAAVGESRPPGCQDCAAPRELQVGVQPPARLRRHNTRPSCPTGTNWIEGARRCCVPCPAGKFLVRACLTNGSESVCDACPAGTFRAQPNTLPKCQACYECDRQAFQSVLSNCSATSNIACGCEPGRFRDCVDEHCSHFSCRQCQPCTGRLIQRPCTEVQDTLCGSCKPNFYAEGRAPQRPAARTASACAAAAAEARGWSTSCSRSPGPSSWAPSPSTIRGNGSSTAPRQAAPSLWRRQPAPQLVLRLHQGARSVPRNRTACAGRGRSPHR